MTTQTTHNPTKIKSMHNGWWWLYFETDNLIGTDGRRIRSATYFTASYPAGAPERVAEVMRRIAALKAVEDVCVNLATGRGNYFSVKAPDIYPGHKTFDKIKRLVKGLPRKASDPDDSLASLQKLMEQPAMA